ncbi:MAG: DUF1722 domain-containing protein [Gammaproteobacteria bacterium]|nr:DUF1722 domain-containing protein [Gammaproteobacteria bacterium]
MAVERHLPIPPLPTPLVGISSCLLGQEVRFDGGHKLSRFLRDELGPFVEYVSWCPEVAIGLGIPRAPIRLTGTVQVPRVTGVKDVSLDVTSALHEYAERVHAQGRPLSGYVLKKGSPSCGMDRVKVYGDQGMPVGMASGGYAGRLMALNPIVPFEEEGRLNDPALRESFIERIFALARWRRQCESGITAAGLVDFHTRHKYLLLSHGEVEYRQAGRLVARAGMGDIQALADEYIALFMRGMRRPATSRRHTNVLQHLMGFLRGALEAAERKAMADMIDEYRRGQIPLVVPIRFLQFHFERHPVHWVALQYYLDPYPDALGVRNHL